MHTTIDLKGFEMQLDAELEKAQALLQQLEARAREKKAQAELDAINAARRFVHKIDSAREGLREATEAGKAGEIRSHIDAVRRQLHAALEQLSSKLKTETRRSV